MAIAIEFTTLVYFIWQMSDYIETEFLGEQVESIRKIAGYIANLKRVGPGHGEYHFDRETLDH